MTIEFRREEPRDAGEVFLVVQDAFKRDDEAQLVEQLRGNTQFDPKLSFVGLVDGEIVAHLLFTPVLIRYQLSMKSISSLAMAPVAVLTKWQRHGIGSQLIEHALRELRAQHAASVIVLGHESFYPRFGFVPAKQYKIRASFPLENENCFMALELTPGALSNSNDEEGIVEYLPEFRL